MGKFGLLGGEEERWGRATAASVYVSRLFMMLFGNGFCVIGLMVNNNCVLQKSDVIVTMDVSERDKLCCSQNIGLKLHIVDGPFSPMSVEHTLRFIYSTILISY
ncbi:hypothetical protein JTE90_005855 [Oedothorax gibbosus]|uniref:Uncharacterized protein n=1 Tax=Oedothorax gibbosus TaxID=931172 RepID=A0AAV6URQ4_9ARAC|nr:hypothetical protein JTE90_005855 [Oedothorax gibbosus]